MHPSLEFRVCRLCTSFAFVLLYFVRPFLVNCYFSLMWEFRVIACLPVARLVLA